MATQKNNPFYPFGQMDMSQFDFTKMMGGMQVPGLDMQSLMDTQRKNIEALTTANQVAVEGMQALAKRQAELFAQSMAEVTKVSQELAGSASNPQELTTKQTLLAREAFERAVANMRELAEMVSKSNTEAFEVINKRFNESLEELRTAMRQK